MKPGDSGDLKALKDRLLDLRNERDRLLRYSRATKNRPAFKKAYKGVVDEMNMIAALLRQAHNEEQ